ncbi:hypothetical protein D3C71_791700 [compost metagenome]
MILRLLMLLISVFWSATDASAQISGVINIYTPVIQINCNSIQVVNPSGFNPGDKVLIIQMKGATIDTSNSQNFGNIISYGGCGRYEFATISSINGSTITLPFALVHTYDASGAVQLIRVPQYTNITVTDTLRAQAWNGSTGGVLVMEVSGTLTLNAPISVSGQGFRGSIGCANPNGSCITNYWDYFYPVSSGFGAQKGEGITNPPTGMDGGRGALGNGGGGGNKHNSGGAGGGNASAGGNGGNRTAFCVVADVGGRGGKALDYTGDRIFMGGGGGSPDHNDNVGTSGTNGGGIAIIRAATLSANNMYIESNGLDVGVIANNIGDGSGGAGAGGVVVLDVQNYSGALEVRAKGGRGGDQATISVSCFGPGGGGGAGMIITTGNSFPPNLTTITAPGSHGEFINGWGCAPDSYGSSDGDPPIPLRHSLTFVEGSEIPGMTFNLGPDIVTCDASVTLNTGFPGLTHLWSNGATGSSITVTNSGTYWVRINAPCNTVVSDTITITRHSSATLDLGNDTIACVMQATTLDAGPGFLHYLWNDGSTARTLSISNWGTFWVSAIDSCNQTHNDTLVISQKEAPPLTLNDVEICKGEQQVLEVPTASLFNTFTWSPANGLSCTQCPEPIANPEQTSTYLLTAETSEGCIRTDSITVNVDDFVPTGVSFVTEDVSCKEGGKVIFESVEGGSDLCYFNFNGKGLSTSTEYGGLPIGNYRVKIYNDSHSQCSFDTLVKIKGEFSTLYIPNSFTPGEGKINQTWKIEGHCLSKIQCVIFNRWGEIIETIHDISESWDGTLNGLPVPDGIYAYSVIATFESGEIRQENGSIALIR